MSSNQRWTIYLAQDKHLDYNWCGMHTEIETRMAALLDYYLEQVERTGSRWNLDGTLWLDVYRRQRGEAGALRLLEAIRQGRIGYAANDSVLLWGILSTELAIRACYRSLAIEQATCTLNKTVLVMENAGLLWGVANILTECDFAYLGRGIYDLRAEAYVGQREPYPLFWWVAPNGKRLLVRWDLYKETRSWGGYAEAAELASMAGETWDAFHVRSFGDRNTAEVYRERVSFIERTVERYEAYGQSYPISSILLLGTGWDNWTLTEDYAAFIRRYNSESNGRVRLVDACYKDFFQAAADEIRERQLEIPTLEGSFGICWEEWAAHLAGPAADFREGERLLRQAEAGYALAVLDDKADARDGQAIQQGIQALLRFAEHDFGGCNRATAAISAGVKAGAAAEALTIARALCPADSPVVRSRPVRPAAGELRFPWRGGEVLLDRERCAVSSIRDADGREWVPQGAGAKLGEFLHTLYAGDGRSRQVFPEAIHALPEGRLDSISCQREARGVEVRTDGERWGFRFATRWFFDEAQPWIDVTYDLAEGWSERPQSVAFCFPLALEHVVYRYDSPGAILVAGPRSEGGDDLPGANPLLFAAQTFAAVYGEDRGAILLTPDAHLVLFGAQAMRASMGVGVRAGTESRPDGEALLISMPMMNLTRNDWQFNQGGQHRWTFRYRLVLVSDRYDPLRPIREAQHFCVPPYLRVPGEEPVVPGLARLDLMFDGGPLTGYKIAEDGERWILRLWNVLDRPVTGSLQLPAGFSRAERCDALERPRETLSVDGERVTFTAGPHGILTVALCRTRR